MLESQQLPLTSNEQQVLMTLLQEALKEAQILEHRTEAPTYREHVTQRKEAIESILRKLGGEPQ